MSLCDKNVPPIRNGKFYKVNARPAMLYGAEMRMMRWMCGHIRLERIKNEDIQDKVEVASMVNKMREAILKWFWICEE